MAYDANRAYVPPQRQYYGQTQPPMRSPGAGPERYGDNVGPQRAGDWEEYQQIPNQNAPPPQRWQEDGWNAAPNRAYPPHGTYASSPGDRSFDPRYYQREARSAYSPATERSQYSPERPYNGPPSARPSQSQYSQERPAQGTYNAQDPSQPPYRHNAYSPANGNGPRGGPPNVNAPMRRPKTPAEQAYELDGSSAVVAGPRQNDVDVMPAPLFNKQENSRAPSMDDWKARERARLQARVPETLAQDNAFPTFPNGKTKDARSSHENSRASTSNVPEQAYQYPNERPEMPRENSYGRDNSNRDPYASRPSLDQRSIASSASRSQTYDESLRKRPVDSGYGGSPYESLDSIDQRSRHGGQSQDSAFANGNHNQVYGPSHTGSSPVSNGQLPYRPSTSPAYSQGNRPEVGSYERNQHSSHGTSHHPQQWIEPSRAHTTAEPYHPVNPQLASVQHANYSTELSQSPVQTRQNFHNLPPGPNSDSTRGEQHYQQPTMQHPPAQRGYHSGPGLVADSYRQTGNQAVQPTAPLSREEQIEAEMPNFDSTATNYRPPQAGNHNPQSFHNSKDASMQSASSFSQREYFQQPYQTLANEQQPHHLPPAHATPKPQLNGPQPDRVLSPVSGSRPGPGPPGKNFSIPSPAHPYESHNDIMQQPPRPPYVEEPHVRRSMDEARQQAPHRQDMRGPPGPPNPQRFYGRAPTGGSDISLPSPGAQQPRVGSAPPAQDLRRGTPNDLPPSAMQNRRQVPYADDDFNPDALPHHPVPVRPGLNGAGPPSQPARPPPVRNYEASKSQGSGRSTPAASAREQPIHPMTAAEHQRKVSADETSIPVTHAEIERLRSVVAGNPNNPKQGLLLAKKLAEAARVLASEGGRADARTTAKNREKYMNEAYKRVKKLGAAGYPEAQFYLADCYGSGELGLEVDSKEAFNLYQAAAKQGHAQAAYRTAVCCEIGAEEGGGTRRDYGKAVQWYRRASALGDVAAMYKLGIILLKGHLGQQRNVGEALNWLKRSADRADAENPHALHELAILYESSTRDPDVRNKLIADDEHARELYKQAAKLGLKVSQFRLGQAYEYGQLGLTIDNRASISWYSKAAAQGEHQAELALSGWYLTGAEGILEQSDTEAYLWARKAAASEPPQPKAMFAMGYFSEQGIGCHANTDEARRWYGRAASYKYPKALERLEELKRGNKGRPAVVKGKHSRKDHKKDESDCAVM